MSPSNVDILEAMLPGPGTDVAALFRDETLFASNAEAFDSLFHPEVESVPAWQGPNAPTYTGVEGFREMWLDWLEPWVSYSVQVDEMLEMEDSVVVLVRDRARRAGTGVDVDLISGSVWTFRDGRIARVEFYANREELREATGFG